MNIEVVLPSGISGTVLAPTEATTVPNHLSYSPLTFLPTGWPHVTTGPGIKTQGGGAQRVRSVDGRRFPLFVYIFSFITSRATFIIPDIRQYELHADASSIHPGGGREVTSKADSWSVSGPEGPLASSQDQHVARGKLHDSWVWRTARRQLSRFDLILIDCPWNVTKLLSL